jgi:hypothetical protein
MINVTLKSQLASTTAKINDIAYCIENKTFYRLSSTDESITIDNTDFIVSNGTNYWIAFGGQNSKVPQKVLNDDLDDSQNVISEIDSSFQLNDGILGLKNFNNDNVQYVNKNGNWTEIGGSSSEVAPVITTTNLMLDATTHSHIFNNNTTDLIHILPLASANAGKRFLLKNKNTGLTYIKTAQIQVSIVTDTYSIAGLYAENGVVNGRMGYVSNYSITYGRFNRLSYDGHTYWNIYDSRYNTSQYIALLGTTTFPYQATWSGLTVTQVTDTIDGLTTIVLPVKGSYIEVESDGVTWNVIRESY